MDPKLPLPVRVFRAFNPDKEIGPTDAEWVDLDHQYRLRPALQTIERELRSADPEEPLLRLFAGGRGVGKSSALLALKHNLESKEVGQPFLTVLIDVADAIDVNDASPADLLVLITGSVMERIIDLKMTGFTQAEQARDYLIGTILSFSLEDFGVTSIENKGLKFESGFQKKRSAIKQARDRIENMRSDILFRFRDLLEQTSRRLPDYGYAGLVVLVDGTDKIIKRPIQETKDGVTREVDQQVRALVDPAELWRDLGCHLVLTLPASLGFSMHVAPLVQAARKQVTMMPLIPLSDGVESEPNPQAKGWQACNALIDTRLSLAGAMTEEVFEPGVRDQLICLSGGHPADLIRLVRAASIAEEQLPITKIAVDSVVEAETGSLRLQIDHKQWEALEPFFKRQTALDQGDEALLAALLYMQVLHYRNHKDWFEASPLVRAAAPGA